MRDVALVFGALNKKNWRAMLARLDHTASHRVFTSPPMASAVDPAEMAAAVGDMHALMLLDGQLGERSAERDRHEQLRRTWPVTLGPRRSLKP